MIADLIYSATANECGDDAQCTEALLTLAAIESSFGRNLTGPFIDKERGYARGPWQITDKNARNAGIDAMIVDQAAHWTAEEYKRNRKLYGHIGAMLAHHLGSNIIKRSIGQNGRFDQERYSKIGNVDLKYPLMIERGLTAYANNVRFDDKATIDYIRHGKAHPKLGPAPKKLDIQAFVVTPGEETFASTPTPEPAPSARDLAITSAAKEQPPEQPAKQDNTSDPRNELTQSYQEASGLSVPAAKMSAPGSFAALAKFSDKASIPRIDLPTTSISKTPPPPDIPDVSSLVAPSSHSIGSLPSGAASIFTGSNARSLPLWKRIRGLLD